MRAKDPRRSELAAIHIAKAELQLDREAYEAIVRRVGGVTSSADLDQAGRRRLLDELRRMGATSVVEHRRKARAPRALRPDAQARLKKVGALLAESRRPWEYAHALAQRMYKVERIDWCKPDQVRGIITALEIDKRRRAERDVQETGHAVP